MFKITIPLLLLSVSLNANEQLWKDLYKYNQENRGTWLIDCDAKKECRSECVKKSKFPFSENSVMKPTRKNGSLAECNQICESQVQCNSEENKNK